MKIAAPRTISIGMTWSSSLDQDLFLQEGLVDCIEFEPQTTWLATSKDAELLAPYTVIEHLLNLKSQYLVHSVAAPVGGTYRPSKEHLRLLKETINLLDSPWVSEHLSFNTSQGVKTGFFMPPRQTHASARQIADNIRQFQDSLGVPVAIENGTSYLNPRSDEMPDSEFLSTVIEYADCGLLLDLHNAYANSVNGRQKLPDFLDEIPLHRVWEIHLAGGFMRNGFWLDAHSGEVPNGLWRSIDKLLPRLPNLRAINFEIFSSFLDEFTLDSIKLELQKIRAWTVSSCSIDTQDIYTPVSYPPLRLRNTNCELSIPQDLNTWEVALTSLLSPHSPIVLDNDSLGLLNDLMLEPGISLIRELIFSFRASMIIQVLRLTTNLILLIGGLPVLSSILHDFVAASPPLMFAILEAEAFAKFVEGSQLGITYLAEVLAYELAAAKTIIDMQARVVSFSVEPLPLLRALADARLPKDHLQAGQYEIEIRPDIDLIML